MFIAMLLTALFAVVGYFIDVIDIYATRQRSLIRLIVDIIALILWSVVVTISSFRIAGFNF